MSLNELGFYCNRLSRGLSAVRGIRIHQSWLSFSLLRYVDSVGGLTGSQFLEGGDFFEGGGGCSFYIKNKLKSQIFNNKKVQSTKMFFSFTTKNLNWEILTN